MKDKGIEGVTWFSQTKEERGTENVQFDLMSTRKSLKKRSLSTSEASSGKRGSRGERRYRKNNKDFGTVRQGRGEEEGKELEKKRDLPFVGIPLAVRASNTVSCFLKKAENELRCRVGRDLVSLRGRREGKEEKNRRIDARSERDEAPIGSQPNPNDGSIAGSEGCCGRQNAKKYGWWVNNN